MPVRVALLALVALALTASAAGAQDDASRLATALQGDPVVADGGAARRLPVADAGKVRLRIVRRDIGRIKIAVVPRAAAARAGGVDALAAGISARLQRPGALLVVAGRSWHLMTSYAPREALDGVRRAAARTEGRRLRTQLLAAVDSLARTDPGRQGDAADGVAIPSIPSITVPTGPAVSIDTGGLKAAGIAIGVAIALAVLIPLALLGWRARRRRAEAAETLADDRAELEDQLLGVADTLRDLDIDVEMPGVDPEGHAAYERALDLRDRASAALARADNPRRLQKAAALAQQARAEADRAQERLGAAASYSPKSPG